MVVAEVLGFDEADDVRVRARESEDGVDAIAVGAGVNLGSSNPNGPMADEEEDEGFAKSDVVPERSNPWNRKNYLNLGTESVYFWQKYFCGSRFKLPFSRPSRKLVPERQRPPTEAWEQSFLWAAWRAPPSPRFQHCCRSEAQLFH